MPDPTPDPTDPQQLKPLLLSAIGMAIDFCDCPPGDESLKGSCEQCDFVRRANAAIKTQPSGAAEVADQLWELFEPQLWSAHHAKRIREGITAILAPHIGGGELPWRRNP
jgi:hypothetical protein